MEIKYQKQGKAIVEQHEDEYLVMLPDGGVEIVLTKSRAESLVKRWFAKHCSKDALGIGTIDWIDKRGTA